MAARIRNGKFHVTLALREPRLSKSGKNFVIATSYGPRPSKSRVCGKRVIYSISAWFKADAPEEKSTRNNRKRNRE